MNKDETFENINNKMDNGIKKEENISKNNEESQNPIEKKR